MSEQGNGTQGQAPGTTTQQDGQAPPAQQGQQGQQADGQAPNTQAPGTSQFDPSTIQDPAVRAYLESRDRELAEARREAARYRTDARTAQEQAQQYRSQTETAEQAAAREAQERQERLNALEKENRDLKVDGVVSRAAATARAHDPSVVRALIDQQITLDEQGQPTNVDALIQALKVDKPFLFQRDPAGADAGAGAGTGATPAGATSINDWLRGRASGVAR